MTDPATVLDPLLRCADNATSGVYMEPPATEQTIRHMQASARRDLGEPVPDAYVALLRVTNGLQIENAILKRAEDLVLENLDVARPEVIVLGSEGNMAEFVFDRRDRRFHIINMGFVDERFASFDSLDALLATVCREQQVDM